MKQRIVWLLLQWVRRWYYKDLRFGNWLDRRVVDTFFRLRKTKGDAWTANYFKLTRLAITRTLAGQSLPRPWGVALCKKTNLPRMIPYKVRLAILSRDYLLISWVLTLLQLSRMILGDPSKFNTDSITAPFTGTIPMNQAAVAIVMRRMGISKIRPAKTFTFPWISTAGPNGLSLLNASFDLLNMPDHLLESCYILGGDEFRSKVSSLLTFVTITGDVIKTLLGIKKDPKTKWLRRISIKADKEGKSRPFAILDYITQSALSNLHSELYQILSKIEQDCTMDQNKGFKDLLYSEGPYYSFDLSSATDRFPIQIQEMVLSWLTSSVYAAHWVRVMVSEPFVSPKGEMIKFATGQPLGAKSSWALFTLSHHFVVWYCAMLCNITQPKYKILGDDIVIQDEKLARCYKAVMKSLGVDISPTKSHEGKTLFEFAKRFGLNTVEISPFPITALLADPQHYINIVGVLAVTAVERGNLPLYMTSSSNHFWKELIEVVHTPGTRLVQTLILKCQTLSRLLYVNKSPWVALSDLVEIAVAAKFSLTPQQVFTAYKNAVMYLKDKEIEKLSRTNQVANFAAQGALQQIMFLPWWNRVTTDYRNFIPSIDVLDDMNETYVSFRKEFAECQDIASLNECLDKHPIRPMPNMRGLQPVRPRLIAGQTRAALIKPLLHQFKLVSEGKSE